MAIVCPQCTTPAALSAEFVHTGGRMLRCRRCGTTWLGRFTSTDRLGRGRGDGVEVTVLRTGRPRFETVIEHDAPNGPWRATAPSVRSAERREPEEPRPANAGLAFGRRMFGSWLGVIVAVFALAFVAMLAVQLSAVDASPSGKASQFAGLEIRLVHAAIEPGRNGRNVVVVGEITNRSGREIAVPAVRIALLADGVERRFWRHVPEERRLAAGSATHFRSISVAPPSDVNRVAFRLADRQDTVAGMR